MTDDHTEFLEVEECFQYSENSCYLRKKVQVFIAIKFPFEKEAIVHVRVYQFGIVMSVHSEIVCLF